MDFIGAPQQAVSVQAISVRRRRRATDTLLLSIWVIGYHALIRLFAALQRVERLLAGSKREDAKAARST